MTYLMKPARSLRRPAPRMGLAGMFDFFNPGGNVAADAVHADELACANKATEATAPLDARVSALIRKWQPTGFYTIKQVETIINEGLKIGSAANDRVRAMPIATGDATALRNEALRGVWAKTEEAQKYIAAIRTAERDGKTVIDAPGLKKWATSMMTAASNSIMTAVAVACRGNWYDKLKQWVVATLNFLGKVYDVAAAVLVAIAGVIGAAIDTVVKVTDAWTYIKYAGLAAIAAAVAYKVKKLREARA